MVRRASAFRLTAPLSLALAANWTGLRAADERLQAQAAAAAGASSAAGIGTEELVTPGSRAAAESAAREGVLVLVDDRVMMGKIADSPGGYLLKRNDGQNEVVPHFLVRTASETLVGCYENLRDSLRNARPDDHVALAEWCLKQQLLAEARGELTEALRLDPNRRDARALLMRVEEKTNPKPRHLKSEAAPARTTEGFLESGEHMTQGLSPKTTSQYVRQIQPLLTAKCASAGCHGGADAGNFQLVHVSRNAATGRSSNVENLRQVLAQVNPSSVQDSPLWTTLKTPTHAKVFPGTAGPAQQKTIAEWLMLAGQDLQRLDEAMGAPAALATSPKKSARAVEPATFENTTRQGAEGKLTRLETEPRLQPVPKANSIEDKILAEERPDPFDPEEFNRLSAGTGKNR